MEKIWRDRIFFALCLALPFLFIPKFFHQPFIGGQIGTMLLVYPLLAFYAYTLYSWKRGSFLFYSYNKFLLFVGIYAIFLLLSLIYGLYNYPYYDLIFNGPSGQIEKLEKVSNMFHEHGFSLNDEILLTWWMVVRRLKGIFFECFYMFFCTYLVYCWYRQDPLKARIIFEKAINYITIIIILYFTIEIAYFFNVPLTKNVLVFFNPILHAISENWGWWPPLLWPELRVRSIFPEPSQFGMYVAAIIPFFWVRVIFGKKIIKSISIGIILMIMLFLSVSKTSTWLLFGEIAVFGCLIVFMQRLLALKRFLLIVLCLGIAFITSSLCISVYPSVEDKQIHTKVSESISGVVNEGSGSNAARFAIIKSDLRIWQDHWLVGVGSGMKAAYVPEYLTKEETAVPEVKMWVDFQKENGVLKMPIDCISEYTNRLAETGILGLMIYLLPVFLLMVMLVKKRKLIYSDVRLQFGLLPIVTAIAGVLASGFSGMMTTFHLLWILLGMGYAYVLYLK